MDCLQRWQGRLEWSTFEKHGLDPARAGIAADHGPAAVLIRPDGFISFRCAPLDAVGIAALEAHFDLWLLPAGVTCAP